MTLTETPNFTKTLREAFTPEEILKYGTYHWRQIGERSAHLWLTIGGRYEYIGVSVENEFSGADEQLPLIPALDLADVIAGGPLSSAGGVVPWHRKPTEAEDPGE